MSALLQEHQSPAQRVRDCPAVWVEENEQMPGQWIGVELVPHNADQTVERLSHIDR
jgi:hypothetical protein